MLNWPRILSFWFQHASSGQVIQGRITVIPSGIVTKIVTVLSKQLLFAARYCSSDTRTQFPGTGDFSFKVKPSLSTVCKIQVWTVGQRTPTHQPALFKIYSRDAANIAAERCVVVPAETFVSTVALTGRLRHKVA